MEKCRTENCKNFPEYVCMCPDLKVLYCRQHLQIHINANPKHKAEHNFTEITRASKEILNIQIESSMHHLNLLRADVIQLNKDLICHFVEKTQSTMQIIRNREELYEAASDYMEKNHRVLNKDNKSEVEEFILKNIKNPEEIGSELESFKEDLVKTYKLENELKRIRDKNNEIYEEQIAVLNKKIEEINDENQELGGELKTLKEKYDSEIKRFELEKGEFIKTISEDKNQIETINNQNKKLEEDLKTHTENHNSEYKKIESENEEYKKKILEYTSQIESINSQNKKLSEEHNIQSEAINKRCQQLETENSGLLEKNTTLESEVKRLNEEKNKVA